MSKYSPGPWVTTHSPLTGYRVSDKTGWGVAVVLKDTNDEANARLIAAAPDMLEALRELLGDFGCIVTAANHNDLATIVCVAKACQKEISELLKKVEGEV